MAGKLTTTELLKLIPQQHPFRFVDEIIEVDNERIVGVVRLARTRMERDLTLKGAILDDTLEISGASLHTVSMRGAELRGGFEISTSVLSSLDFSGAKIAGSIKLSDVLLLSGMSGVNATFERGMTVEGCRSKGAFSMSGATGQGGLILSNLTVEGHLMPPLSLEGTLNMNEVTIYQNLIMIDGHFADATISKVQVVGSSQFAGVLFVGKLVISDTDFGKAFSATEALFDGEVEFRKVRFPGENPMEGALFASAPTLVDTTLPHPPELKPDKQDEGPDEEEPDDSDDAGPGGD